MENNLPEFAQNADNVYRTENYIVKQFLISGIHSKYGKMIISFDTYYLRNKDRDKQYNKLYADRPYLDGFRYISTMSKREYKS